MTSKPLIAIPALAALSLMVALPAAGEGASPPSAHPSARHAQRITVNPGRLLYRHCVDWYELQNRPSGPVLYPQMRCRWVRG